MAGTDTMLLCLHGLRLGGVCRAEAVAARWDLDDTVVDETFRAARARGWVTHHDGVIEGWALTSTGRAAGENHLAVELDAAGARPRAEAAYATFRPMNRRFLDLCTDWQLRTIAGERVVNDHTDPEHDARVLQELAGLDAAVDDVLVPLAGSLARFDSYRPRFDRARARVVAGDLDWFTGPLVDSYHTVWFELHEDLLATLGRSREEERPEGGA